MSQQEYSLALSNPMSALLDKSAADFQRADLLKIIEKRRIERITFHYTALDGRLKELHLPATSPHRADTILAEGERVDGSSLFKGMVDSGLSDLYIVPVYRSAFLNPFDEGSIDFVCRYLTREGKPAPFTPDNILAEAYSVFKKNTGLELRALGELEFFLFGDSSPKAYPAESQRGYHASAPFFKSGPILKEILGHVSRITGSVKYAHAEVGLIDSVQSDNEEIRGRRGEQLEVEYLPRPIDVMADDLVIGRWIIRNVAYRHGALATFAPKIEEGVAGSGLHIHLELLKEGRNIMSAPDGTITESARRLVGGLCEYADTLTAFGNTMASSYLRLVPNQEAPTRVCWSDCNRSAMIRVPLSWSQAQDLARKINPGETEGFKNGFGRSTVELRSPDGSALLHLLLAGIAMAADWGFRDEKSLSREGGSALDLAERFYVRGNIFKDEGLLSKLPVLPSSCVASSRLLLKKRGLYERGGVFPGSVIEYVARLLEKEDDEFIHRNLAAISVEDRLRESRKIMHRDLHRN